MLLALPLLAAVLFLAYTNGANDNFKGVATLFGSRTTDYRRALAWATLTTFAGSLTAVYLSQGLIKVFSGKGLVPTVLTTQPAFLLAVGSAAALTVFLATLTGFPISTTHALLGALVGAGWMAVGSQVNLRVLGQGFILPLAVSPVLSLTFTGLLYPALRVMRERAGVSKELCVCIGPAREPVRMQPDGSMILRSTGALLSVGETKECVEQYRGVLLGVSAQHLLDACHYLSAGVVSFARGLNDAPKMVALLVAGGSLSCNPNACLFLVAAAMALGGLLNARNVAHTMSQKITAMNHGQGFTANLVTGILVLFASRLGMPVSTTHLSCGALFGIGVTSGRANPRVIRNVISSWIITLPVAAVLSAGIFWVVSRR